MLYRKYGLLSAALAGTILLSACGQGENSGGESEAISEAVNAQLTNGMTAKELIDLRHEALEEVGDAFKTISDQLKSDNPDLAAIQSAAAGIPEKVSGMEDWFPAETSPETGLETDALASIWENKEDFLKKVSDMQEAAIQLNSAAESGDVAAIGEAFKATGGTCKSCHDDYRKDD